MVAKNLSGGSRVRSNCDVNLPTIYQLTGFPKMTVVLQLSSVNGLVGSVKRLNLMRIKIKQSRNHVLKPPPSDHYLRPAVVREIDSCSFRSMK